MKSAAVLLGLSVAALAAGAGSGPTNVPATLWSLQPLAPPVVPPGRAHPIDAFIQAKLAAEKVAPSPPADRRTLIRRLAYNLTGLPPTWNEAAAFAADPDPAAYDKLLERLLFSPRRGEHWARHWLDVANYADTHGNDHDYIRPNAWPYRDYVIRAFNEDKPYARFVQEQVAGDALFPGDPEATVALGFLAASPWDHTLMVTVREDTVDHRQAQNLDRDSMVSAAMGVFQSLTVHCARCHDHKFDPISQREYYSLQAVFAGVDRADRPFDAEPEVHRRRQQLLAEQRALRYREPALLAALNSPEVVQKTAAWEAELARREASWTPLEIESVVSAGGAEFARQEDGSWLAGGRRPDRDTYIVTARWRTGELGSVRLQVLSDDRLPQRGPGRWDNGNFHLSEFRAFIARPRPTEGAQPLAFARARADYDEGPRISAAQAIDGKTETHWGVHPRYGEPHEAVFELKDPVQGAEGATLTFLLEHQAGAPGHGIGRFRLSGGGPGKANDDLAPLSRELAAMVQLAPEQRTKAQRDELAIAALTRENERALAALPAPQMVYAITRDFPPDGENFKPSPQPRPIHLLTRGELSKPREPVGPGTVHCVPGLSGDLDVGNPGEESERRAALARWLTDGRNALTWRSIVNRVWHWHFGRGLCDTPNDFGAMGGTPLHPELLDWLAVWFRDEAKGSLRALSRLILTSDTWKQTSLARHGTESDSDNRLLWRQHRLRLTAEQARDSLLFLSGQLDLAMGGPSAVQFISKGDATFVAGGNPAFLDYENFDPDSPAALRRAIYRFLFRTVPDPLMDALDCPDGGDFTPVRADSTTAQQAFALLNDPFVIRQAEHLARRLSGPNASAEERAESAFRTILQREASPDERAALARYIEAHGFANACQWLLNSNEFLYLD